jgi:hypothetical protein
LEARAKMSSGRIPSRKQWEARLDAELKNDDPKQAWQKLLEHHCDPKALKSALYYAADHLWTARAHQMYDFYTRRKEGLTQVAQLKETIRQLMAIRCGGDAYATVLMLLSDFNKIQIRFFQDFPALLVRFEKILKVLKLPVPSRQDTNSYHLVAQGEALLHLYVKEVTGRAFPDQVAALLQAAAAAAGIDYAPKHYAPEYTTEAVSRRYRRLRKSKSIDPAFTLILIRSFKKHKRTFVDDFLHLQRRKLRIEWALWKLLYADTEWARATRRSLGMRRWRWPSSGPRS